jgi:hypothetical protein
MRDGRRVCQVLADCRQGPGGAQMKNINSKGGVARSPEQSYLKNKQYFISMFISERNRTKLYSVSAYLR